MQLFIEEILLPLLKLVYTGKNYNWVQLDNKDGYWRKLEKNEGMSVGGEVSLNLSTGMKMIKLK